MTNIHSNKFAYGSADEITIIKKNGRNVIKHKFLDYSPVKAAETLIIGTFNPGAEGNKANFFYSRPRNYLWRILSSAYLEQDLKKADRLEKENFSAKHKVAFIDLIEEVKVDAGQEVNYADAYLDKQEIKWRNVLDVIKGLPSLKRVCFTRSTYADIPKMNEKVVEIANHCKARNIKFQRLVTPARYYNETKQVEWNNFLLND